MLCSASKKNEPTSLGACVVGVELDLHTSLWLRFAGFSILIAVFFVTIKAWLNRVVSVNQSNHP